MLSVETLLIVGFIAGVLGGLFLGSKRVGCWIMAIVPIAAIGYVSWWQGQNPEGIRSTSGLEFVFVPIPPTIAALIGYGSVWLVRDWLISRNQD
jgi:hypothetical protein